MPHETLVDQLGYLVSNDLLKLVVGDNLGWGQYREVYVFKPDETKVIKVEKGCGYENIAEYDVWQNVKQTKWARWFAPVLSISPFGSCLIQPRCRPVTKLPRNIPDFFADVKIENWGMLNGRVVCFDYGHHKFYANTLRRARLVRTPFRRA